MIANENDTQDMFASYLRNSRLQWIYLDFFFFDKWIYLEFVINQVLPRTLEIVE